MLRIRIASLSLVLAGCQTMPDRPVVEVGLIDYPSAQVIAGLSDGSDPVHRVPLVTYDRATCYKPSERAKEKLYIELLEQYAQQCKKVQDEATK